ncbi:potassium channel family protein [Legionella sp. PC997]|uniref:potassium channel family protein n=1 Tax=Legionella sp. PC997 TaxID=2755562 RepID=UPI0015F928B1
MLIYELVPQSISGLEPHAETRAIYYSFITLTTVGFGDVVATGPIMQCLSWMEAFCGQAYLAIFISQLVGRYIVECK